MTSFTYRFLISSFAGLSTLLGCIFLLFSHPNNRILIFSLAFAAGVMFSVSILDLLPSSFFLLSETYWIIPSFLFLFIALTIGIIFSMIIDKYFEEQPNSLSGVSKKKLYHVGLFSMFAIILHNIPEGIATFMTSSADLSLGFLLAIAIALHNIPEGISISVPIYYATGSKKKAFFYTVISSLSEPFGALLAYFFLGPFMNSFFMGILYSLIAGIMIHICFCELLPTSYSYHNKRMTLLAFLIGFLFMMMIHFLFV